MTINSVNLSNVVLPLKPNGEKIEKNKVEEQDVKNEINIVDKFEKSEVKSDTTYTKSVFKRDEQSISKIKAEADQIHSNLRSLVEKLLSKQGMTFKDLNVNNKDIEINEETTIAAQKSIDEGGELIIENVSSRLVDFAKAISGGDKSKISLMRDSIKEGFSEAEKAFGGTLPEISYKTLERAMKKLDEWENE